MSLYIHFLEAMCLIPRPRCAPRLPLPCLPVPTGVENLALDGRHRRSHPRGPTHIAHSQGPERPAGPPPPPRPQASLPPVEAARRPARKNKRDKQEARAPAVATDTPAGGPSIALSRHRAAGRTNRRDNKRERWEKKRIRAFGLTFLLPWCVARAVVRGCLCGVPGAGWATRGGAAAPCCCLLFCWRWRFSSTGALGQKGRGLSCGDVWGTGTGHRGPERQMLRGPGHTATATVHGKAGAHALLFVAASLPRFFVGVASDCFATAHLNAVSLSAMGDLLQHFVLPTRTRGTSVCTCRVHICITIDGIICMLSSQPSQGFWLPSSHDGVSRACWSPREIIFLAAVRAPRPELRGQTIRRSGERVRICWVSFSRPSDAMLHCRYARAGCG